MAEFDWTIHPLVGLGPLRFGMGMGDVAVIMRGHAVSALDDVFDGSKNEFRTMDLPVCNYLAGKLHAIDTSHRVAGVTFEGADVYAFDPKALLVRLETAAGGAKVGLGMVLFERIGVNTSGFYDATDECYWSGSTGSADPRGLGLFEQGAFDHLLDEFLPADFREGG